MTTIQYPRLAPGTSAHATTRKVPVRYATGPSPIGHIFLAATDNGICALYVLDHEDVAPALERLFHDVPGADPVPDPGVGLKWIPRVVDHLVEGRRCDDLPLDLHGTDFQRRVWHAIAAIPRGTTTSYAGIARSLGLPSGAARAVGTACGSNPISLIVPCHRVLRSDGGLGGYGWGLERKQALLEMEGALPGPLFG